MVDNQGTQVKIKPVREYREITKTGIISRVLVEVYDAIGRLTFVELVQSGSMQKFQTIREILGDKLVGEAMKADKDAFLADELADRIKSFAKREAKVIDGIAKDYFAAVDDVEVVNVYLSEGKIADGSIIMGNLKVERDSCEEVLRSIYDQLKGYEIVTDVDSIRKHISTVMLELTEPRGIAEMWLCFKVMSFMARELRKLGDAPHMLLSVIAQTQSFKTSSAIAFFNPQKQGSKMFSFKDSQAAIRNGLNDSGGFPVIADDLAYKKDKNEAKSTFEMLLRLAGDTFSSAKRMRGNTIIGKDEVPFIVMTGEFLPKLQESSLARLVVTDLSKETINREKLTYMQKKENITKTISVDVFLLQAVLKLEKEELEKIQSDFISKRNELVEKANLAQRRFAEAVTWFMITAEFINKALEEEVINLSMFEEYLCRSFNNQWKKYSDSDPIHNFIYAFIKMLEKGGIKSSDTLNSPAEVCQPNGSSVFMLVPNVVFKNVIEYMENRGYTNIPSYRDVMGFFKEKALAEVYDDGTVEKQKRFSDGRYRVMTIYADKFYGFIRKEIYNV